MTTIISHRGNLVGPDEYNENMPSYLRKALDKGFQVECDIWFENGCWFLGHDEPDHGTP